MWRTTNIKKSTSISISTRKRIEWWAHTKNITRESDTHKKIHEKKNILYIFMFDTHLMLFGYITRIFVYAIWNMVILLCYSKSLWHFLYLIRSPSIFMFILNNKIEEKKNIICRTFHLRIHIYIRHFVREKNHHRESGFTWNLVVSRMCANNNAFSLYQVSHSFDDSFFFSSLLRRVNFVRSLTTQQFWPVRV